MKRTYAFVVVLLVMVLGTTASVQAGLIAGTQNLYDNGGGLIYDADRNITWYDVAYSNAGNLTWDAANSWAAGLTLGSVSGWRLPSALEANGGRPQTGATYPGSGGEGGDGIVITSELAHLWVYELGNDMENHPDEATWGPFTVNGNALALWSGTDPCLGAAGCSTPLAYSFYFGHSSQGLLFKDTVGTDLTGKGLYKNPADNGLYYGLSYDDNGNALFTDPVGTGFSYNQLMAALAVHDGDIGPNGPIPTPAPATLLLLGPGLAGLARLRRKTK